MWPLLAKLQRSRWAWAGTQAGGKYGLCYYQWCQRKPQYHQYPALRPLTQIMPTLVYTYLGVMPNISVSNLSVTWISMTLPSSNCPPPFCWGPKPDRCICHWLRTRRSWTNRQFLLSAGGEKPRTKQRTASGLELGASREFPSTTFLMRRYSWVLNNDHLLIIVTYHLFWKVLTQLIVTPSLHQKIST